MFIDIKKQEVLKILAITRSVLLNLKKGNYGDNKTTNAIKTSIKQGESSLDYDEAKEYMDDDDMRSMKELQNAGGIKRKSSLMGAVHGVNNALYKAKKKFSRAINMLTTKVCALFPVLTFFHLLYV